MSKIFDKLKKVALELNAEPKSIRLMCTRGKLTERNIAGVPIFSIQMTGNPKDNKEKFSLEFVLKNE